MKTDCNATVEPETNLTRRTLRIQTLLKVPMKIGNEIEEQRMRWHLGKTCMTSNGIL